MKDQRVPHVPTLYSRYLHDSFKINIKSNNNADLVSILCKTLNIVSIMSHNKKGVIIDVTLMSNPLRAIVI